MSLSIAMLGHKRIPSREGGVEIVVEELSARMAKKGHSVTCYNRRGHHVSGNQFDETVFREWKGVKIRRVLTIDKKGLAAVTSSFFAAVASAFHNYDIVHFHAEGPSVWIWIPKLLGKKCIVTIHGLDWKREKWKSGFGSKYIKFGEKMAVRYADAVIVLSHDMQNYFQKEYGRKTYFIPNGVNVPGVHAAENITERWGLHKDEYILFLGRIVPEKGIHYLLEAYKQLDTSKKLVISGGASDTEDYFQKLKKNSSDSVIFTGFVSGQLLDELYSNAYLYCLPSDLEGMPLSLLEAMSYGNCCVVSDIPECTETVEDHAAVFKKGDVTDLTRVLQTLCDDEKTVRQYKNQSAEYIQNRFNWDYITEETLEVYKSILQKRQ